MTSRQSSDHRVGVGSQLRKRREDLGLTQAQVAETASVSTRSVGLAENGQATIQLRKRRSWEAALHLRRGTITRAYRDGTPFDLVDESEPGGPGETWRQEEWRVYRLAGEKGFEEKRRREMTNTVRLALWGLPDRRDWTPPPDGT